MIQAIGYSYPLQTPQIGLPTGDLNSKLAAIYPDLAPDERNLLDTQKRNELLFNRNKLDLLAKYGNDFCNINAEGVYKNYKNNKDFLEMKNSKYFNNAQGFTNLVRVMAVLDKDLKEKALFPYEYNQQYLASYYRPIAYEKYNMNNFLKMLNDFCKNNKISDDLKQYFLQMKADKIDLYYTKLNRLSASSNPVDVLTERITYVNE